MLVDGIVTDAIPTDDRGLAYGDGLFETIAWRNAAPRFLARHMERLAEGCRRLALDVPDTAILEEELRKLAAGSVRGTGKIIVTRGSGPRGYLTPDNARPRRIVSFSPAVASRPLQQTHFSVGVLAVRASSNPALAGMKTLNRLDSVLARSEVGRRGLDDGLMLDAHDCVVGSTAGNVFLVEDGGHLVTPDLAMAGVRGVMRSVVIEAAAAAGVSVSERAVTKTALGDCRAAFLTNALIGLRPVDRIDDRAIATRQNPVVRAIIAGVEARGVGICES
ncbi:MAG: aminodeoxychorismate lyase [Gammaproteobacteria bacterium]|nr:aminodeoxychorismate lyase [Gammaproteobacteria bacterium]